jgi:hypothetical protein
MILVPSPQLLSELLTNDSVWLTDLAQQAWSRYVYRACRAMVVQVE